ncbi:hypothetical protein Hdeb2414_s0004g00133341 [Helianthus debilis subsp. tardiflorus]
MEQLLDFINVQLLLPKQLLPVLTGLNLSSGPKFKFNLECFCCLLVLMLALSSPLPNKNVTKS